MKKLIFVLFMAVGSAYGATDVRETGAGCVAGAVSVSTTTPTLIPTAAFSGRSRIDIQNTSVNYNVAVGTHSALTHATGFIVGVSTAATARLTIFVPSGFSLYGVGEANATAGTVNVRYLECK